jgi:hypothetical protein
MQAMPWAHRGVRSKAVVVQGVLQSGHKHDVEPPSAQGVDDGQDSLGVGDGGAATPEEVVLASRCTQWPHILLMQGGHVGTARGLAALRKRTARVPISGCNGPTSSRLGDEG